MKRFIPDFRSLNLFSVNHGHVKASTVAVLMCTACISLASSHDQQVPRNMIYHTEPPTPKEIGQHLFPEEPAIGRTRSIVIADPTEADQPERSVGMPILFHFGKTTIVEKSQPFLDSVGEMLTTAEYADRTLVVEGHTDAVGSREYNQRLSELRALAVKDYLVEQFSIDPYRLFPMGQGEDMLYQPDSPNNAVNRRVEFLPYNANQEPQRSAKTITADE